MRIVQAVQFTEFEWDERKAEQNVLKHGIAFEDAAEALTQPHIEYVSRRQEELRVLAICPQSGRLIGIIYTRRGVKCRIISARPARDYEQREYRFLFDR